MHVNAEFADQASDHDPSVARLPLPLTFDSLCGLARLYSLDPAVADGLCDKLASAASQTNTKTRDNLLQAFRNQVDAQTGKALTAAQAATLKDLSLRLQGL